MPLIKDYKSVLMLIYLGNKDSRPYEIVSYASCCLNQVLDYLEKLSLSNISRAKAFFVLCTIM